MTKYRKRALIEAEQWDGSQKMVEKYHIPADTLHGGYIVTDASGDHWFADKEYFEEKYEEVKGGCEYCRRAAPLNSSIDSDFYIHIFDELYLLVEFDDQNYTYCPINFCPKCGRKLQEVEE